MPEEKIIQKIIDLNPHWREMRVEEKFYALPKRKYFDLFFPLASQFAVHRSVILMGPRRVGKTVLLWQTIQQCMSLGKRPQEIVYLPVDTHLFYACNLDDLLRHYKQAAGLKTLAGALVIFDEIQYQQEWDRQLKALVDQYPEVKFIASGSAAGALKRESQESGAGRFTDFMLPPLTFYEYLELLNLTDGLMILNERRDKAIGIKNIDALNQEFLNFLNYGGFPEAIFNEAIRNDPTRFIREDIIDKVLLKDLPSLYGIGNVRELDNFFHHLTYQTGNEISYTRLTQSSGVAKGTIQKYIEYLEAAFLIRIVQRIDETGKHFKKHHFLKVYLTNPSMYAAVWGLLSENEPEVMGHLVETAVFSQWMHDASWLNNIYYARFRQGRGEVDMVHVSHRFKPSWCLEVKWSDRTVDNLKTLKSLRTFCEYHQLKSATVTTRTIKQDVEISPDIMIRFRPAALVCFNIGCNLICKKIST